METRWKILLTLLLMSLTWMTIDLNSYTRFGMGQSLRDQSQVIHGLSIIFTVSFWRCDEPSDLVILWKNIFSVMSKISDTVFLLHPVFNVLFSMLGFIYKRQNCYVHELKPGKALRIWLLVHVFGNTNYNITVLTFILMIDVDVHLVDRSGYKRLPKCHQIQF